MQEKYFVTVIRPFDQVLMYVYMFLFKVHNNNIFNPIW